jgi:hypothetical protein
MREFEALEELHFGLSSVYGLEDLNIGKCGSLRKTLKRIWWVNKALNIDIKNPFRRWRL